MQKIGDITSTSNPAGEFTEGNPGAGAAATLLKSGWFNTVQRELIALVVGAGLALNKDDDTQVFKAVKALAGVAADFLKLKNLPTTLNGYGITDGFAVSMVGSDYNAIGKTGLYLFGSSSTANRPVGFNGTAAFAHLSADGYGFVLSYDLGTDGIAFRKVMPGGFGPWRIIWHAGNFDPSAKADKTAVTESLSFKANSANPTLTGVVTVPSLPLGTNTLQAANAAFVQAAIANLVAAAPGSLDTLKELADALGGDPNFATTVLNALAGKANKATDLPGYGITPATPQEVVAGANNTKPATSTGVAAAIAAIDPWALVPIGVPVPIFYHLADFSTPPTNKSYRYISLTANDSYNAGVLTGEVISGSFPLVVATAVVSLAGSPMNGKTINFINTEQRVLRATQVPGQLLQDGLQNIIGTISDLVTGPVSVTGPFSFVRTGGATTFDGSNSRGTVTFNASSAVRTADETRVKSIGVIYFMRVK